MLHYVYGMDRVIWHSFSRFHGCGGRGDNLSILLLLPWQLQLWTSKICRHSGILHVTLPWIVLHVSFFWKRHQLLITFPFQPLIDYTGKELKAYRAHLKKNPSNWAVPNINRKPMCIIVAGSYHIILRGGIEVSLFKSSLEPINSFSIKLIISFEKDFHVLQQMG